MLLMIQCWLLFTVLPFSACHPSSLTSTTNQIIYTLTRALHFFSSHVDQVNLDAGIGTRMAADQLRPYAMCQHCQSIRKLVDLSESVTWQIARAVRSRQPDYYAQLSFLLMPGVFADITPFQLHTKTHPIESKKKCSSSPFIEKRSDRCLHALAFNKCNETEACVKLMSDPDACRYSLTHQILYSIVAKKSSCHHHRLSTSDEHRLVEKMFEESQSIAHADFPESDRDLFMEQMALGGVLGYKEFFQDTNSFHSILRWQHPREGCYGNGTNDRNKREEMQMLHRCLSHRTSVAVAALSQMLRYLLSRDI